MTDRSDMDKVEELMLPGFRFHPTDEELVGFYLKRKIQQRPLSIELIKQLDIYKFDPWDLPKLAATGEKEWYFYCPRDRKYRNSARPNRVTGAGFWKATGTDRPIYSSEGTRCIGLKKSLVFYRGRAAKGTKTDWMMHEFRLPSLTDSSSTPRRPVDKKIPANDAWAICRIFQKTNSMAQRALSLSWLSQIPETPDSYMFSVSNTIHCNQFDSENISSTTEASSPVQFGNLFQQQQQPNTTIYPPMEMMRNCKPYTQPISNAEIPAGFMFSPFDISVPSKSTIDVPSMLQFLSPTILGDDEKKPSASIDLSHLHQQQCNNFTVDLPLEMIGNLGSGEEEMGMRRNTYDSQVSNSNNQWGTLRTANFPFNLTPPSIPDAWSSDISTAYLENKCYT